VGRGGRPVGRGGSDDGFGALILVVGCLGFDDDDEELLFVPVAVTVRAGLVPYASSGFGGRLPSPRYPVSSEMGAGSVLDF
jgi:hypothetical protein